MRDPPRSPLTASRKAVNPMTSGPTPELPQPEEQILPLFALPDLTLFPGVLQPLMICEDRYCQLVEDVLDTTGLLVMGTVLGEGRKELDASPMVQPIAGLGRFEQYQKLPDGRFVVLIRGEARVLVREVDSEHLYRQVAIEPLEATSQAEDKAEVYRDPLCAAIHERVGAEVGFAGEIPVSALIDLLLMHLDLAPSEVHGLYSLVDLEKRAQRVLTAHSELS